MDDITANYRNLPRRTIPLFEDSIEERTPSEPSEGSPSSRDGDTNYRKNFIGTLKFRAEIVEEDSRKRCNKIFTPILAQSLYPLALSYKNLIRSYKTDRLARQMFYEASMEAGTGKLYLGRHLDGGYQVKRNFVVTIEQETGLFFLDTPFGRRKIKKPGKKTKVLQTFGKSKGETINGLTILLQDRISLIIDRIFKKRRVNKTSSFINFETYIKRGWRKVDMEPQDENLAVHYCPSEDRAEYKLESDMFTSYQINKISARLRSKTKF